ncbi:hypothetical protein O181_010488 [Austropuccinia psidii MF-1]|uniref:Uncharacterized protein n=1 Tax=Austropuccinia psidii MF-1 TaxID=1389203 RepID=A0A9Q3BTF3_9BASI|nr:hypothetical protein [Austropuccinia psidii MF-1]
MNISYYLKKIIYYLLSIEAITWVTQALPAINRGAQLVHGTNLFTGLEEDSNPSLISKTVSSVGEVSSKKAQPSKSPSDRPRGGKAVSYANLLKIDSEDQLVKTEKLLAKKKGQAPQGSTGSNRRKSKAEGTSTPPSDNLINQHANTATGLNLHGKPQTSETNSKLKKTSTLVPNGFTSQYVHTGIDASTLSQPLKDPWTLGSFETSEQNLKTVAMSSSLSNGFTSQNLHAGTTLNLRRLPQDSQVPQSLDHLEKSLQPTSTPNLVPNGFKGFDNAIWNSVHSYTQSQGARLPQSSNTFPKNLKLTEAPITGSNDFRRSHDDIWKPQDPWATQNSNILPKNLEPMGVPISASSDFRSERNVIWDPLNPSRKPQDSRTTLKSNNLPEDLEPLGVPIADSNDFKSLSHAVWPPLNPPPGFKALENKSSPKETSTLLPKALKSERDWSEVVEKLMHPPDNSGATYSNSQETPVLHPKDFEIWLPTPKSTQNVHQLTQGYGVQESPNTSVTNFNPQKIMDPFRNNIVWHDNPGTSINSHELSQHAGKFPNWHHNAWHTPETQSHLIQSQFPPIQQQLVQTHLPFQGTDHWTYPYAHQGPSPYTNQGPSPYINQELYPYVNQEPYPYTNQEQYHYPPHLQSQYAPQGQPPLSTEFLTAPTTGAQPGVLSHPPPHFSPYYHNPQPAQHLNPQAAQYFPNSYLGPKIKQKGDFRQVPKIDPAQIQPTKLQYRPVQTDKKKQADIIATQS